MFPYADGPDSYWTGYFTSRANHKEFIRRASQNMHASNKLYAFKAIDQSAADLTLFNIKNAKDQFLDIMGVNQHHDAATGTGKQAVDDNYSKILFKGLEANNQVYASVIADAALKIANLNTTGDDWLWCFKTNSTYLDCPISNYEGGETNIVVAVHNPSLLPMSLVEIAVPHGHYDTYALLNGTNQF
jgi:alpha-mannosidase